MTCSHTELDDIAHEQTIICRHLFAGYVVGSRPMKRKIYFRRTIIDRSGACLRSPLPPYPFCCQKGYPFRRNHRLKANFVEYFFVSKYFRQHPCINNIFGSSRSESRLCSYPVGFSLLSRSLLIRKNVTFLKTLQGRREDDTMSTLGVSQCYISPSLFEKS